MSISGAWNALRWPTGADMLLSVKAVLAITLALTVGFSQNLENPYWSGLTIYTLLSQPDAGGIRSKALFRLLGTLFGGAGAVLLASALGSHIGVELIATIAAMLLSFYARTLDRTPANYTWFSTALTFAVIGVIHVQQPDTMFAFAATRVAEISLGILAIGIVDSILLPKSTMPTFLNGMTTWRDQAAEWAADALAADASLAPEARLKRRLALRALAAPLGPLDVQGVQLPYDVAPVPPRGADLRFLRLTIARLLIHLSAANVWIEAARAGGRDEVLATELRDWLGERPDFDADAMRDHAARGEALAARLEQAFTESAASGTPTATLHAATQLRLSELAHAWATLERLLHAIATGSRLPADLEQAARRARPVRAIDYLVGLIDIAPMALALCTGALIWYLTAWSAGINAMLFAFVVCSFIIGTPGAVRSAAGASLWTTLAFAVTFLYLFVVLPRVTAFPVLMAVLATGLLPLGLFVAMSPAGLLITANAFAFLGLQNAYAADFATTLQSLAGSMAGCLLAAGALFLCQYDRARFRARRLAAALDRDVADVARSRRVPDGDRLLSLSVDRVVLFFGIVNALPDDDPLRHRNLASRLRVLGNMAQLRVREHALPEPGRAAVRELRQAVARNYGHGAEPDRTALLGLAERSHEAVAAGPADRLRARTLAALTGLRIAWTPDPAFEALLEGAP